MTDKFFLVVDLTSFVTIFARRQSSKLALVEIFLWKFTYLDISSVLVGKNSDARTFSTR